MTRVALVLAAVLSATIVAASTPLPGVSGAARDETGAVLPGVLVELVPDQGPPRRTVTDAAGTYRFEGAGTGAAALIFSLSNFATQRRRIDAASGDRRVDVVLHLALSADVTVTGRHTFTNLADAEDPVRGLVGIAQAASQGAVTARQLERRPILRAGEVLEAVPGVVISQHSGEGKANQYYLRGFNLDHGTDFATTVAGMPVNLPTHGHGHGYSDLSFLIPELVSGVQFSKGPYFADQGDFATAGAANISYANVLDRPILRLTAGGGAYGRALAAGSREVGRGVVLGALEVSRHDGPWERPDGYRKVNGVLRYSRGAGVSGLALTAMAYGARWRATDQVPARAVADGRIGPFGTLDPTDGGRALRASGSFEWQRASGGSATRVTAYAVASDLDLFSNFTYFLDDPERGDQFHQVDRRVFGGGRATHRRIGLGLGRLAQITFGAEARRDDIRDVGLHHTAARVRLSTVRQDVVRQTSAGVFAQGEVHWAPWLRTLAGVRADGYRFAVRASDHVNGGVVHAGLVSPKGGVVVGPWRGTEVYVNAGAGFHSNDARGATITRHPVTGEPVDRVTPLVRARGAEAGLRTVAIRGVHTSVAFWTLGLDSELVFAGDAGTTEAGRPSRRHGVEWATYFSPRRWLLVDADVSLSRARFSDGDVEGALVPGAVETVVSAGVTAAGSSRFSGSARLRYLGPRPLVEDGTVRSRASRLVNVEAGFRLSRSLRLAVDVFNLFDASVSDIDYFYASRLPGEPAGGIEDLHGHPAVPRTVRVSLVTTF